ncbi:efflux RND transporter periplasmic adaptor subunit [Rhodobacter sp. Har01]|uniref:efflux RND transporter periplasmic adaptor subunit n=1 Tax=Rhodobacter sp. Har01 TaxID=2883999 RepID=UPI001D08E7E3|nr:efflux RND transporter periplasmic adaptor subunit [Rhodobacter sp. Har01]MCB6179065.1 efflux RND transporter periplasmic adaptor subunit [Rhodobacter sp. Har01]
MTATAPLHPPPRAATPFALPAHPWRWGLAALALAALGTGLFWWQAAATAAPEVSVETLAPGPVTRVMAVNGKVAAHDSVRIRPAVTGTLQEFLAGEGDLVAAGDVLARIDPSQQEAMVRQANSTLQQGLISQAQASAVYGRDRDLGALVARSKLEDEKLALSGAAAEVARLTALLDQAEIQLARYTVRAPIAGTVMTRSVDPGQLVDPATALFTLADLSRLIVETDVDESYATQIALGQPVALQLAGTRDPLAGTVSFVSPRVDPDTGGMAVRIGFDLPLTAPVGLTVTANITVDSREALTVPRTALQGDAVFRLLSGRAVLTPVKVIDWPAARLIVTEGLAAGDRVITDASGLTTGMAVTVTAP